MQVPINYLAVVAAAIAAYVLSFCWYALCSTLWMKRRGQKKRPEPELLSFIVAGVAYLLMAWMLAGLMGHLGNVTVRGGIMAAFLVWTGFVLTTTVVNQMFRGAHASVTLIDAGNWLLALLVMGAVIGAFGL